MEKYQITINDSLTLDCDGLGYEYSQLDSESSGRSEDSTMFRDVLGLVNKVYCNFERASGTKLRNILNLMETTSCMLNYYCPKEGMRVTKSMYVVVDKIDIRLINGEEIAEPFEIRFIQMNTDSVG